jgi:hypothetical protein
MNAHVIHISSGTVYIVRSTSDLPFRFFKKHSDEIQDRQEKIIAQMPVGANSESERREYVNFLLSSLEACSNQSSVNELLVREIERTDCLEPAPSLYRRLSMKVLLALDERRMRGDSGKKDKEDASKIERPRSVAELSDCPCQNKQQRIFNPIQCFVRAAQEQVGAENVAVLMRGDIFALSFSRKHPFPWEHIVSLESGIYVDDRVLKNSPQDALLNKIMNSFAQHANNWGSLLSLKSWFMLIPSGGDKMLKIPFDIGPSDVVGFGSLFGNIVTTTGHLYGNEEALGGLAASMARLGMGRNYHVARTVNLYKHTVALAKAWSEIRQPHPDILKGWEKLASPAYSYLLLMLANSLKGG